MAAAAAGREQVKDSFEEAGRGARSAAHSKICMRNSAG